MIQASPTQAMNDKLIVRWLLTCAVVIFGMILLGGVTRLTDSGLSMVEWQPLMGIIPPLSHNDWQQLFLKYQQFPEYQQINLGMTLGEFKVIFMYEYLHRVLGRLIGLLFFIPFVYFFLTRRISPQLLPKLLLMLLLGGCQGLMGWYMVKSGLIDVPHVSQYRLTAHLGLAIAIYGFIVWTSLGLINKPSNQPSGLGMPACIISGLIFLMILSGGLVAGTRAGYAYSTWPLMGDSFIPAGLYDMSPIWLSAFENITTIQFNHRMFAYIIALVLVSFSVFALKKNISENVRIGIYSMLFLLLVQITLGISTLIFHVPVAIAAAHQIGSVALLTATLFVSHSLINRS
ncbi:MAG: Heme A synthase [Cellvibrionales bacterium UBA7375]|nr:heme A synthase [Porticoccaceae bacterium]RPG83956.1 MAG: heme A synthase [Cellvibrionales bacterium TMED47]CAI8297300.1 MAG: Heme A synthase [Cellvibrionales bacterium UBA7375]